MKLVWALPLLCAVLSACDRPVHDAAIFRTWLKTGALPEGFSTPPGADLIHVSGGSGVVEPGSSFIFEGGDSPEELYRHTRAEIEAAGWEIFDQDESGDTLMVWATGPGGTQLHMSAETLDGTVQGQMTFTTM